MLWAMADSFPIPVRTGVAREPLDPTAIMPGPQPLDVSERAEGNLIVGEVLRPGRHRAFRPRRKVAISGAVLSAAGAMVTLALMTSHSGGTTVQAAPRVSPSVPMPDLPDEPAASQHPAHTAPVPKAPAAVPVVDRATVTVHTAVPAVARTAPESAQQRWAAAAAEMRAQMHKEAAHSAQVWAAAMRQAASGRHQQAAMAGAERQSAEQNRPSTVRHDEWRDQGGRHGGHGHGGWEGHHRGRGGR